MRPLEPEFLGRLENGPSPFITILTTAPMRDVEAVYRKVSDVFPKAAVRLITQRERKNEILKHFPGADVHEALPGGLFKLRGLRSVRVGPMKNPRPDLMIIIYNNSLGRGYFGLELFSLLLRPRRLAGAHHQSSDYYDEVYYCDLTPWRLLISLLMRIALFPAELALGLAAGRLTAR